MRNDAIAFVPKHAIAVIISEALPFPAIIIGRNIDFCPKATWKGTMILSVKSRLKRFLAIITGFDNILIGHLITPFNRLAIGG